MSLVTVCESCDDDDDVWMCDCDVCDRDVSSVLCCVNECVLYDDDRYVDED